jgi:hypothetical protein
MSWQVVRRYLLIVRGGKKNESSSVRLRCAPARMPGNDADVDSVGRSLMRIAR